MSNSASFTRDFLTYSVKQLISEDEKILQQLYEECTEFALFIEGKPPSLTAACDEFNAVPEGKTTQDKYIFGLFDSNNILLGIIESIRHYPDHKTWWLGLMMLAPQQRGKGLGTEFYKFFEQWVSRQGIKQISLSVVEANKQGLQFWEKMGFKKIKKTPPKQFGNKTHSLYIMNRIV